MNLVEWPGLARLKHGPKKWSEAYLLCEGLRLTNNRKGNAKNMSEEIEICDDCAKQSTTTLTNMYINYLPVTLDNLRKFKVVWMENELHRDGE